MKTLYDYFLSEGLHVEARKVSDSIHYTVSPCEDISEHISDMVILKTRDYLKKSCSNIDLHTKSVLNEGANLNVCFYNSSALSAMSLLKNFFPDGALSISGEALCVNLEATVPLKALTKSYLSNQDMVIKNMIESAIKAGSISRETKITRTYDDGIESPALSYSFSI